MKVVLQAANHYLVGVSGEMTLAVLLCWHARCSVQGLCLCLVHTDTLVPGRVSPLDVMTATATAVLQVH